jgi:hypothetical protein
MPSAVDRGETELQILYEESLPNDYFIYTMTQILVGFGWHIVGVEEYYEQWPSSLEQLQHQKLQELYAILTRLHHVGLDGDRLARAYANATDTLMHFYAKAFIASKSSTGDYDWSDLELHFIQDFSWGLAEMMRPVPALRANYSELNPEGLARSAYRENWDALRNEPGVKRILDLGHIKAVQFMAKDLYDNIEREAIAVGNNFIDDAHKVRFHRYPRNTILTVEQEALATAEKREIFTDILERDIDERLLQPEVSTVRIIDFYVKLINQIEQIDESGLLLDNVSDNLRQFLRSRDDAVRIVVTSLLEPTMTGDADQQAVDSTEDYSGQVARLMQQYITEASGTNDRGEFWPGKDLADPNWTPAPIGSGPGKRAQHVVRVTRVTFRMLILTRLLQNKVPSRNGTYDHAERTRSLC